MEPVQRGRTNLKSMKVHNVIDHSDLDKNECLTFLSKGVSIKKYVRYGAPHFRDFTILDSNKNVLAWRSGSKKPEKSRIYLDKIWKIELGQKSKKFLKRYDPELQDRTVSLYFDHSKSLDLEFESPEQLRIFLGAIQYRLEEIYENLQDASKFHSMQKGIVWGEADANEDGTLTIEEVKTLVKKMGCSISDQDFQLLYREIDMNMDQVIDRSEFNLLISKIFIKNELKTVFNLYSQDESMDIDGFRRFLHTEQRSNFNDNELVELFREISDSDAISFEEFCRFITSNILNSAFDPNFKREFMDMTQPLTHYFIESSHNTYLVGHQLTGESSFDMYAKVLLSGCRCVELDIWDGGNNEPKITHGRTLVSNISLEFVCKAISTSAFKNTPYPLILSLENHCSEPQQERIAEILVSIFADQIYVPTDHFPSPELLQYKVLIKCKKSKSDRLNSLIALMGHHDFLGERAFNTIPSRSETKMMKLLKDLRSPTIVDTHKRLFTRIYPGAKRFGSSNYNPVLYWLLGCQIVALNYQTFDLGMLLNNGFFEMNGNTGYVLKPEFLRDERSSFFINNPDTGPHMKLTLQVISAQSIPHTGSKVYIKAKVHGIPSDCAKFRTSVIKGNRFNPIWDEMFVFEIKVIEISMLTITIHNKGLIKGTMIGGYALPVSAIQQGYRVIPILDKQLDPILNAHILCKFNLEVH